MDEYETPDIVYVTNDDERNARGNRDHRKDGAVMSGPFRPKRKHIVIQSGGGREPIIVREAQAERVMAPLPVERRLLGTFTASEAVEAVAQVVAALQPLPAAPVATGKAEADIANLTLYSAALAQHAKRDEQLRTLGSLLSKLMS